MDCPEENLVLAFIDGLLVEERSMEIEVHLDRCDSCRELVSTLVASTGEPESAEPHESDDDEVLSSETPVLYRAPHPAPSESLAEHPPLQVNAGMRIEQFRIMRLLGKGGMGTVYLGLDMQLGRKVALKFVTKAVRSTQAQQWALHEARAIAKLNHPNIVTVYSVGTFEGHAYVALEYVDGETLRDRFKKTPATASQIARVCSAIAQALAEGHARGIFHRDLKPGNVLFGRDGRLRLLDFGMAAVAEPPRGLESPGGEPGPERPGADAPDKHREGEVLGTPLYMAPEQWLGQPATEKTDIWALGLILFELLAKDHPFPASSKKELKASVVGPAPAPTVEPSVGRPKYLCGLAARCLAKEASQRPTAREVIEVVARNLDRAPRKSAELSPFRGLEPFRERHADYFFGRSGEVDYFLERLRDTPVLPIVGPSGCGKTSFVRAGVLPRLSDLGAWTVVASRPGHRPFHTLARGVLQAGGDSSRSSSGPSDQVSSAAASQRVAAERDEAAVADLAQSLLASPGRLMAELVSLAEKKNAGVFLLVDQLEEICTLQNDAHLRNSYMEALCRTAGDYDLPIRVVFTLRDDFLAELAAGSPTIGRALGNIVLLGPPNGGSLLNTLVEPIRRLGYRYDDPDLPRDMVGAVEGEEICLPLLQFVARKLWDLRDKKARLLKRAHYESLGGVGGALAKHADGVLASMSDDQQALAKEILLRLVTRDRTRRLLRQHQVLDGLGAGGAEALERLTQARLLSRRAGDDGSGSEFELAHESLIQNWGRLSQWLEATWEDLVFLQEVEQAADLWRNRGEREDELWQRDALAEARAKLSKAKRAVPELVERFVQRGTQREDRQITLRARRRWLAWAVLGIATVVSLGFMTSYRERGEQVHEEWQRAERRRSEAELEGAWSALGRTDHPTARAKLRGALEASDSMGGRALWLRLQREPLVWKWSLRGDLFDVAFSPDGKSVAVAAREGIVHLGDLQTADTRALRGHRDVVRTVAFFPSGLHLVSGDSSGEMRIWDLETGGSVSIQAHEQGINRVAVSHDGELIATAGYDTTVRLWRSDGVRQQEYQGHSAPVYDLSFAPRGDRLVSVGWDGVARFWDLRDDRHQSHTLTPDHAYSVALSPNGRWLAWGGEKGRLELWDLEREPWTKTRLTDHTASVVGVAFNHESNLLASGSLDRTVRIWDVSNRTLTATHSVGSGAIERISFDQRRGWLAAATRGATAWVWDTQKTWRPKEQGHRATVWSAVFSPDGQTLASSSYDHTIRLWDPATGQQSQVLRGHGDRVREICFMPDGQTLVSASEDRTIRLWDLERGAQRQVLSGHSNGAIGVACARDGGTVVSSGYYQTVRLWDLETAASTTLPVGHEGKLFMVEIDPAGRMLATGGWDQTIRLWDLRANRHRGALTGHSAAVWGISYHPEGDRLASAGYDGSVRLWDLRSRQASRVVGRHDGRAQWVRFSPDGKHLISSGSDQVARLWDLESQTGKALHGHRGDVNGVGFSPDGTEVVSGGDDGTVRLWSASTGRPLWRGPYLQTSPPRFLTHRGWLDPTGQVDPPASSNLRDHLEAHARLATERRQGPICEWTYQGQLALWNREDLTAPVFQVPVEPLKHLSATRDGCLVISGQQARAYKPNGDSVTLASRAQAATWSDGRFFVADEKEIRGYGEHLEPTGWSHPAVFGLTVMAVVKPWLALGFRDGAIGLVSLRPDAQPRHIDFQQLPSSPVTRLAAGPGGTLLAGFTDGHVGIWSLEDGRLLDQAILHGPIAHLELLDGSLYVLSDLGDFWTQDLSSLFVDYCDLLHEVWQDVPVIWENGRIARRAQPDGGHGCREPAR